MFVILYLIIFGAVLCVLTWFLLKIFPCLKKLNWKALVIISVIFKIFDIHSTYLCFAKAQDYEAEANFIFQLFFKIFGLSPLWALMVSGIISAALMIWIIRLFLKTKHIFLAWCVTFGGLLAAIHNYLGYFFLGKL